MSTLDGDSDTMQPSSGAGGKSSPVPMLRKSVSSSGLCAWPLPRGVVGVDDEGAMPPGVEME